MTLEQAQTMYGSNNVQTLIYSPDDDGTKQTQIVEVGQPTPFTAVSTINVSDPDATSTDNTTSNSSGGGVEVNGKRYPVPGMTTWIPISIKGPFDWHKLAIGYSTGVSGTFQISVGVSVTGVEVHVMYFNSTFGGYIHDYVEVGAAGRAGASEQATVDAIAAIFVALSRTGNYNPDTWAYRSDNIGADVSFHAEIGGGVSAQGFWNKDWEGIAIGVMAGFGPGFNLGTIFRGVTYSYPEYGKPIPTAQRNILDRILNIATHLIKLPF